MKNKKQLLIICGVFGVILVIAAAVGFIYQPKTIFLGKINTFYKQTSNSLLATLKDNEYNQLSATQTMQTKGDVSWQIASPMLKDLGPEYQTMLDEINKSSLTYDVIIDKSNQKLQADLDFNYNNTLFQNIKASIENEYGYVYLTDVYQKYIKFPVENSDELFKNETSIEDAMYVSDFVLKNYVKNIPSSAFSQDVETLNLNGTEVKTRKLTYEETPQAMAGNMIEVIQLMKKDAEVQKRLMNLMGYKTKTEVNEALDNMITNLKSEKETKKTLAISIYVKGITNEFVRLTIGGNDASSSLVVTKMNPGNYQIDILEDNQVTVKINFTKDDELYKYKINLIDSNYVIDGMIKTTHQVITKSKQYRDTLLFTINVDNDGNNMFSADINNKTEVNFGVDFKSYDIANNVSYDALTEEDQAIIYQKLMDKIAQLNVASF